MRKHIIGLFSFGYTLLLAGPSETQTLTFRVSGVECGSCMYSVQQSISEAPGVKDVNILPGIETLATVTFDPAQVSEHKIAQSVRDALPLHGTPYLASLKIKISNPPTPELKRALDQLREKWRNQIRMEPVDKEAGSILIHFEPLPPEAPNSKSEGWSLVRFKEDAGKAGVAFSIIGENQ